ncbi:MAG TPA: zinc ribbon domain-containing protein [Bryobacteraceae bacterium]|nr:zinc ribbon domain-containing protein [Bryobacteraceae bacterium]
MRNLSLVNEFCTCGAKLPEDARFCHKCGKPQREEPEMEALAAESAPVAEIQPPPLPVGPPPRPPIGFRNPMAVRAALLSSAIATLAGILPLPGLFHTLWQLLSIVAGGFASVYIYQRRTGDYLSVRGGLQIGWMTGLFCFLVMMVMLTFVLAVLSALGEAGLKKLAADSGRPEVAEVLGGMLSNPAMLIFALVTAFFFFTMLGTAGGALGSKVLERE